MKKSTAIVIMIMYLLLTPVKGYCEAGSLVVAGGSIATGGLALAGTPITVPVLAAIGVGLTACGLNIELTRASQEAGLTKTQFILQKLEEYRVSADKSLEDINNTIANGVSVTKDGTILLSNQASKQIKQFGNWLFASNNVASDAPPIISGDSVVLNGVTYPVGTTFTVRYYDRYNNYVDYQLNFNNPVACVIVNYDGTDAGFFNVTQGTVGTWPSGSTLSLAGSSNGYYYNQSYSPTTRKEIIGLGIEVPTTNGMTLKALVDTFDGAFDIVTPGTGTQENTFVGDKSEWDQKSDALSPSTGQTEINPDLLDKIITTVGSGFVGVNDYLRSIADAIDGIAGSIPITDGDTGTVTTGDVPITDSVPTIDVSEADPPVNPDPDTPEGTTPLVDPDKPATGANAIDPLKLPLKSFFPFCIPFDVKDMVSKLSASPVAPSYHVHWFVPIVNQYLDFTVDLSGFNSVASIARKMELLAFVVGLAIVTRSMFIRG